MSEMSHKVFKLSHALKMLFLETLQAKISFHFWSFTQQYVFINPLDVVLWNTKMCWAFFIHVFQLNPVGDVLMRTYKES